MQDPGTFHYQYPRPVLSPHTHGGDCYGCPVPSSGLRRPTPPAEHTPLTPYAYDGRSYDSCPGKPADLEPAAPSSPGCAVSDISFCDSTTSQCGPARLHIAN